MLLKVVAVLCILGVGAASRPGCRTRYELKRKWADEYSAEKYWECVEWGKSIRKDCPKDTKFLEPYQTCVPSKSWIELPYYSPPSNADDNEDACGFIEVPSDCPNKTTSVHECGLGFLQNGSCICQTGASLVNQVCIMLIPPCEISKPDMYCGLGYYSNGFCNCDYNAQLINGTCVEISHPQKPMDCLNGIYNETKGCCDCFYGYELINGQCQLSSFSSVPYGICQGSEPANSTPGTMACSEPVCTESVWKNGTLYPTPDPTKFFQCHSPKILSTMPCAPGTCFDFKKQVCVHPIDWVNVCAD